MDSGTDDFDFPQEWFDALVYNLAMRIAPAFGKQNKLQSIAPLAQTFKEEMLDWDNEKADVQIVMADY